jgi:hypothetical protein
MRTCLFFIVDGRKLEAQTCLLAPSLRRHLGYEIPVIAYRRKDAAPMQPITEEILAACKIELRQIPGTGAADPSPWTAPYPIGNKIMAASDPRDCDISVFIDTDMVFAAPVDFAALLGEAQIAAVISDYTTLSNTIESWTALYRHFNLPLPEDRVRLPRGRRVTGLPYFNAGLIVFREAFGAAETFFGAEWLRDAIRFDHEITIPYARENIDQITLSLTAARLGEKISLLPNRYNFNLPAYGNAPDKPKALIHYHRFGILWSFPELGRPVLDDLRACMGEAGLTAVLDCFGDSLAMTRLRKLL